MALSEDGDGLHGAEKGLGKACLLAVLVGLRQTVESSWSSVEMSCAGAHCSSAGLLDPGLSWSSVCSASCVGLCGGDVPTCAELCGVGLC